MAGDDDVEFLTQRRRRRYRSRSPTLGRQSSPENSLGQEEMPQPEVIEIDDLVLFEEDIIDLTGDTYRTAAMPGLREGEFPVTHLQVLDMRISKGDFVEVRNIEFGQLQVDFVEIDLTAQDRAGRSKIRGTPYVRTRRLQGKLPKKEDEVCQVLHYHKGAEEVSNTHVLVEIPSSLIVRKRRLIFTNAPYTPRSTSIRPHRVDPGSEAALVCGWKLEVSYVVVRQRIKPEEKALIRIHRDEVVEAEYRVTQEALSFRWRGETIPGGSWNPKEPPRAIDVDNITARPASKPRSNGQKYTVFDSFSGAGGVSRGAMSAGFKVTYAVDKEPGVWDTYRVNFPKTKLYKMSVDELMQRSSGFHEHVDILHLSPPCQFFSPAHTRQGPNDDENTFAIFACQPLIEKTHPRLITLEQTFGLTHDQHLAYFRALVGQFTQLGYSVRWRIVRLCTWGLAQDRKRLIMIAAAPGERLPTFPKPTHSQAGGANTAPFNSIHKCISRVRRGDDLHDLDSIRHFEPPRRPYNAHVLAKTMTTSGLQDSLHPSGTREFTLREYAYLQGFPGHHRFRGNKTSIKRQIGNAWPPNTVAVLYKHLEEWLLRQDGMLGRASPRVVLLDVDTVTIDDE